MDRALWLLLWLRLWAWLRRVGRMLHTVRGMLLFVVGSLVVGLWLFSLLWQAPPATPAHLANVRRYGPLVLVGLFVINLLFNTGERAITFTPAEVNLLFPGPFTRRQLLAYKVVVTAGAALLSALFMTLFLRQHMALFVAGFIGMTLTLLFLQLLTMLLALLASAVGVRAHNRQRKLVLAALVGVLAVSVWQASRAVLGQDWAEVLAGVDQSPLVQALLTPLRWFVDALTAERIWPDLVQWSALALLVDMGIVGLLFALDAHYLEASAAASDKLYTRLQRARRGGVAAVGLPRSGRARFSLPALPVWGGIGPLAWRQLTTVVRSVWALVILLILCGCFLAPMLADARRPGPNGASVAMVAALVGLMTLFVTPLVPYDFRGDLDRMDVLKVLPLPAWRIVVGQLVTPVLLIAVAQVALLVGKQILLGRVDGILLAATAFTLPFNVLLFAIENLFFLWFPTRTAGGQSDFLSIGRYMLLWLAKVGTTVLTLVVAALAGWAAYHLAGRNLIAGLGVSWLVMAAVAVAIIPLVALAFRQFDVAADVPP